MKDIIDKLYETKNLSNKEWTEFILNHTQEDTEYLFKLARKVQKKYFGNKVYARGLIEISNYCKNNCYYCGIRRNNQEVSRYRLTKDEIIDCCNKGYDLGFRTFVLQGGEDVHHTDEWVVDLVQTIRKKYKECAITLSIGEKNIDSYQKYFNAGTDRYLLRHETADDVHYQKIHPKELSGMARKQCLYNLKKIGFQTGTGFMIGTKGQTIEHLIKDLKFIQELNPHMIGIGPFIPHHQTPFANEISGTVEQTLLFIGILRLMMPKVLLPATTALGTIEENGRENGILAGANVVMPNISPVNIRKKYELYDNKLSSNKESAEGLKDLEQSLQKIGYELSFDRGDHPDKRNF